MKLSAPVTAMLLGVALAGCSSTSTHGTAGSGGQAGSSTNPGSGGAAHPGTGGSANPGSGGAKPGSGGAAGLTGGATGGSGSGTGGAKGGATGGGGTGSGGIAGGSGGASAGGGGGAGAGMCAPNERWCAGCTPGSGTCSSGPCPAYSCPVMDAGAPDAPGDCSTATTETDCNARGACHAVFVDGQACDCATLGCCTHFSRCAEGATAMCSPTAISCTVQTPHCEGPYVVSYAGGCFEGCVRSLECAGGAGGAGGSGAGGHGGHGGSGGAGGGTGQACSSAPPMPCPTGLVCDEDMPNRCGAGAVIGHCIVKPDGCTADYTPVCGCDNHTYSNDCERQRAQVQLSHTGACT